MARFRGKIGYLVDNKTVETPPGSGNWVPLIIEVTKRGDVKRNSVQVRDGEDTVNSDLSISHSIEVVADAFATEHVTAIRYVEWAGVRWSVEEAQIARPRLILKLGGVYNGPLAVPVSDD